MKKEGPHFLLPLNRPSYGGRFHWWAHLTPPYCKFLGVLSLYSRQHNVGLFCPSVLAHMGGMSYNFSLVLIDIGCFMSERLGYFLQGVKDTIPTMLGYIPASIAFGITGSSLGLSPLELLAISFFVYAGSAQFFILASLQLGTPIITIVFLVFLLNLRHLLYGPIIEPYLPEGLKKRLLKAFLLTDEVFAVCYLKLKSIPNEGKSAWYFAVGLFAWWSWLLGTLIGVYAGEFIFKSYPLLAQTMGFALTALFVGVTFLVVQSSMLFALALGGLVSLGFAYMGWSSVAMLAGAAVAYMVYQPPKQATTLHAEEC